MPSPAICYDPRGADVVVVLECCGLAKQHEPGLAAAGCGCRIISIMNEDDVRTVIRHSLISFDTDSGARAEDGKLSESKSHPRAWGTFTRILGHYVRDEQLLTLEDAVRKMTSQAAIRVGIADRGLIRPGMFADLVVFDPATVQDKATFEDPNHYSVGMRHVFVNGRAVVSDGAITTERPGRPLHGPGRKAQRP